MRFLTASATDAGIKRKENQDSFLAVTAQTSLGPAAFLLLCDGMGGLSRGELASAEAVRSFSDWFARRFPVLCRESFSPERLWKEWGGLIAGLNGRIANYGRQHHVSLGTTATGLLFVGEQGYGLHVGDSRAYELSAKDARRLTRDQTLVQRELERGNLSPQQAETDGRRHVLLQCIGASPVVEPEFFLVPRGREDVYLLCSDGLIHQLADRELCAALWPQRGHDAEEMSRAAWQLVDLAKERGETDNITAVLLWEADTDSEGGQA